MISTVFHLVSSSNQMPLKHRCCRSKADLESKRGGEEEEEKEEEEEEEEE